MPCGPSARTAPFPNPVPDGSAQANPSHRASGSSRNPGRRRSSSPVDPFRSRCSYREFRQLIPIAVPNATNPRRSFSDHLEELTRRCADTACSSRSSFDPTGRVHLIAGASSGAARLEDCATIPARVLELTTRQRMSDAHREPQREDIHPSMRARAISAWPHMVERSRTLQSPSASQGYVIRHPSHAAPCRRCRTSSTDVLRLSTP